MRNNGGFILIKINKLTSLITADDFDKKLFHEIHKNHILKPVLFQTLNETFVSSCVRILGGSLSMIFTYCGFSGEDVDTYMQIFINYNDNYNTLSYQYSEM